MRVNLENSQNLRVRMRALYFREFFEGNSRKFLKFESENEGNIFESFGNPTPNHLARFYWYSSVCPVRACIRMCVNDNKCNFICNYLIKNKMAP